MKVYEVTLTPYTKTGYPTMTGRARAGSKPSAVSLVMKSYGMDKADIKKIVIKVES